MRFVQYSDHHGDGSRRNLRARELGVEMGGAHSVPPTGRVGVADFGPMKGLRVEVHNGGGTVVIAEAGDPAFAVSAMVKPRTGTVDVVIHGVPGRFATTASGETEIPLDVLKNLLENNGVSPGSPLRLITCHGGESPLGGASAAEQFASVWGGAVSAPNGFLKVESSGQMRIHVGEWDPHIGGGQVFTITGFDAGTFIQFKP